MDDEYEKDRYSVSPLYEVDYEEYRGCDYGEDDEERDYYDDGREETDEREEMEFTARDIYDIFESVAYYNYVSRDRYDEESECCCCGSTRRGGSILCESCASVWDRMSEIDGSSRERMYDKIVEWIRQKQEYSFGFFLSVCFKDIEIFVKDDRKAEAVNQLVRCLKRIEMMKLAESRYVDDLIQSIAQRWNIVEIS